MTDCANTTISGTRPTTKRGCRVRVGHARRRALASSTALAAALATVAVAPGAAVANDNIWRPSVGASVDSTHFETSGTIELFLPAAQSDSTVFFLDLRLHPDEVSDVGGAFGAGVRHILDRDVMIGANAFYHRDEIGGALFEGASLGAEIITPKWDAHLNYTLSFDGPSITGNDDIAFSVAGNQLLADLTRISQVPLEGVDGGVGRKFTNIFGEGASLRFSAGGYHYYDEDGDSDIELTGARAGVEFEYKPFDSIDTARLTFGAEVTHDNVYGTEVGVQARFVVPLGGQIRKTYVDDPDDPVSVGLRRRANDRVRINGLVAVERRERIRNVTPIDPDTGEEVGEFFFVDDENTEGAGTFEDPTTLADAVDRAGEDGFVFALENDFAGNIDSNAQVLADGLTLAGGGSTVQLVVDGTPTTFDVPGEAGTIEGTSATAPVLTLGDGNTIQNVTLTGGAQGLFGTGIDSLTTDELRIVSVGGDGVELIGATGTISFDDLLIDGTGADGLALTDNDAQIMVMGGSIDGTADDGIDAVNTEFALDGLTIGTNDAIGDDGIEILNTDGVEREIGIEDVTIGSATAGDTGNVAGRGIAIASTGTASTELTIDGTTVRSTDTALAVEGGAAPDAIELSLLGLTAETGGTGFAVEIDGTLTGTMDSSVVLRELGTLVVDGNGTGGGVLFDEVRFDADDATAGDQQVMATSVTIGDTGDRVQGDALSFLDPIGALSISTLDIANDTGTGLEVFTKGAGTTFDLATAGGTIDTTNGTALFLDPLTGDITLDSVSSTNATALGPAALQASGTGNGIYIEDFAATDGPGGNALTIGSVDIDDPEANGILVTDSGPGRIVFGDTDISNAGEDGVELSDNTAEIEFGDTVIALGTNDGSRGVDIENTNGAVTFGDLDISNVGTGSNQVGFDLAGAALTDDISATSVDITGPTSSADSVGIDLTAMTGNQNVTLGEQVPTGASSSIVGLNRGVVIDDTAEVQFTFGDGESANDRGSTIDVNSQAGAATVDAGAGTNPASNFNFLDVTVGAGDTANFPASPTNPVFVSTSGGTVTAGTNNISQDVVTISVADAEAAPDTDQIFVFVGNGMGNIDVQGGGADGFTLDAGQSIDSFNDGNAINLASVQPANVQGNLGAAGGSITSDDVTALNNLGFATSVIFSGGAGGHTISNLDIEVDAAGEVGLSFLGSTDTIGVTNVGIDGTDGTGVNLTGLAAAANFNDVDIAGLGTGIDHNSSTALGDVTFDANSSISDTSVVAVDLLQPAGDFTFSGAISETDATGAGIVIDQATAASTITFGGAVALNTGASNGVEITNNAAAIAFNNGLDIDTTMGTGFAASGGGSVSVADAGTETITSTNGKALDLDGVLATLSFDSLSSTDSGSEGVEIDNLLAGSSVAVTGTTTVATPVGDGIDIANSAGTFTFASIDIDDAPNAVELVDNAGTTIINGGTIDGGNNGINALNSPFTASGITFGATTQINNDGVIIANNDATDRTVTLDDLTMNVAPDVPGGINERGVNIDSTGTGTLTVNFTGTNELRARRHSIETDDGGNAESLILNNAGTIIAENFALNLPAIDIAGTGADSTIVTALGDITVFGDGAGGNFRNGVLFDRVTFDADVATAGNQQVSAGTVQIGQSATQRVIRDGLSFINVSGDLSIGTLNVFNTGSGFAALEVDNSGLGTTFTLGTGAGTLDATNNSSAIRTNQTTLDATFDSVAAATNVADGVVLLSTDGTLTVNGGTLVNSGTGNALEIGGGSVAATFSSGASISNTGTGAAVLVNNGHTGSLSYLGTINATDGTGLQFNNAQGSTYTFNNAVTLNGGDAGVDIIDTNANFTFSNLTITDPTGIAFNYDNSSGAVTWSFGTITQSNTATAFRFNDAGGGIRTLGGTTVANTSTANAIEIIDSAGTINFTGPVTANTTTGINLLVSGGSAAVTLPSGSSMSHTGTGATVQVDNGHSGSLSYLGTINATGGTGLQFNNAQGTTYTFNNAITLNGGDAGVDIVNSDANFTLSNLTITDPTGTAFNYDNSSGAVTWSFGTITQSNAQNAIRFNNAGGGIRTLGGDVDADTSTANAIEITNSLGAFNFTGDLDLDTTTGTGFNAVGSGTVTATGTNTADSTTGTAVNIVNTTIGAAGVNFQSVSANGATNGIVLNNTGTQGGLAVTGTGTTDGSGGTIQNTTGSGILLTDTQDVSLANMNIANTGSHGIEGTRVTNLDLTNLTITSPGDAVNENGITITDLLGTSASGTDSVFDDVTITGSSDNGIDINNGTATNAGNTSSPDLLTVRNSTITGSATNGILVETNTGSTGNLRVDVTGSTIEANAANGVLAGANGGDLQLNVSGSTIGFGAGNTFRAVTGTASNTGDLFFTITGNTLSANNGTAGVGGATVAIANTGTGEVNGTIGGAGALGNTISNATPAITGGGTTVDGVVVTNDGAGTTRVAILNNDVTINDGTAIRTQVQGGTPGGTGEFTIEDNTVTVNGTNFLSGTVTVENVATAPSTLCLDIANNTLTGPEIFLTNNAGNTFRVVQTAVTSTANTPGADNDQVETDVSNAQANAASVDTDALGDFVPGGASCTAPSTP